MQNPLFKFYILCRWKRSSDKSKILSTLTNQPILQFLAIKRKDCGKWAIPGVSSFSVHYLNAVMIVYHHCWICIYVNILFQGFLNTNEDSSTAILRELFEEAVNPDKFSDNSKVKIEQFFSTGKEVKRKEIKLLFSILSLNYKGYR